MELEKRIARIEAESAIRRLIAAYCFTIDDRDMPGIAALFADDARVASQDGVMEARGIDAIMAQYRQRFAVLGPAPIICTMCCSTFRTTIPTASPVASPAMPSCGGETA